LGGRLLLLIKGGKGGLWWMVVVWSGLHENSGMDPTGSFTFRKALWRWLDGWRRLLRGCLFLGYIHSLVHNMKDSGGMEDLDRTRFIQ